MHGAAPLGEFSESEFLEQYWQKKPLLVRSALPAAALEIPAARRLELACSPEVDSRLIVTPGIDGGGSVEKGPFELSKLEQLGDRGWTLLLQEADRHEARCAALLEQFRFIPNWRIDDAMLSHAVDGGGVGAHVDRYDVFLIQIAGRRRWRIENAAREEVELRDDSPLPLITNFAPEQEWVLEAGDLLYLPPGIAHEGVALGECATCSIGFRTPDPRELYSSFLTQLPPVAFDRMRYADADLSPTDRPGEIPPEARERLRRAARDLFASESFDRWVGRFVSRPLRRFSPPGAPLRSMAELHRRLETGAQLRRSAPQHFVWTQEADGAIRLFVGGEDHLLERRELPFAQLLCGRERLDRRSLAPHLDRTSTQPVLVDAVLRGMLRFEPADGTTMTTDSGGERGGETDDDA